MEIELQDSLPRGLPGSRSFLSTNGSHLDKGGIDHALPLQPASEGLDACRRPIDHTAFGLDHPPSLGALDDLGEQNMGDPQTLVDFVTFVLNDTQNTWSQVLPQQGVSYRHAKLVLFRDAYDSACGTAQSATGPFYCPEDEKVYIDLGFYDELKERFGAPGEFAEAYVLAHEIGHHVQKLLGIEAKMRAAQQQNPGAANQLSVALELQADCFAGVWGHSTQERNLLDPGDVDSGLKAAAAVGDDRIQRMSRGTVNPETFTHGSSAQRMQWFQRGFQDGSIASCNTFQ
jgi:hypothetical protein